MAKLTGILGAWILIWFESVLTLKHAESKSQGMVRQALVETACSVRFVGPAGPNRNFMDAKPFSSFFAFQVA